MGEINRIGCSGWYYKEWAGLFYPKNMPPKNFLPYYLKFFNTVEVNNTFYRFPSTKTVSAWYKDAPEDFKYSLKASSYITHSKRFHDVTEPLKNFYSLEKILKEKMGCFLFQFPKNFSYHEGDLMRIVARLDSSYQNVLEFRHQSWWNSKVFDALASVNALFCTVSAFGLPDDLIVINGKAYIRFHGHPLYSSCYSNKELATWGQKIQSSSLKFLWAYFNNDRKAYAPHNALSFKKITEEKG